MPRRRATHDPDAPGSNNGGRALSRGPRLPVRRPGFSVRRRRGRGFAVRMKSRSGAVLILGLVLAAGAGAAFPTKPVRMLVGFAPGGGTDTAARAIGARLGERLGQTVVIDNRPGAAGNIATELTVNAVPDGHTILLGSIASFSINPSLYKRLAFDPLKDLAPLTRVADSTNILVTHPSAAVKTVKIGRAHV